MSETKILLAEDNKLLASALQANLQDGGFSVVPSFDGQETLDKMKSEKPDILLLDILLPVKNGFEVLEEIKKDEELKTIPVIILTNLAEDENIDKAKELGALEYLVKSNFTMDEVMPILKKYSKKD